MRISDWISDVCSSDLTADKFVVRLPDGMRERIAEVARNRHRSMNSEIIARLEQSLLQEGALDDDLNMRLDSTELTLHERELLQRFRPLAHRQQNALIALIAQDTEAQKEDSRTYRQPIPKRPEPNSVRF